jgi:predicted RNA-binding protein with TRAM domain
MPIRELKAQPVKVGEELVVDVTDIHESGAGVGHTDDGFVVFVDGILPDARARVKITKVKSNHARAEEIERLSMEDEETDLETEAEVPGSEEPADDQDEEDDDGPQRPPELGSRDNFWGG